MNSFPAISALVCPAQMRSRTSCSRRVSPSRWRPRRRAGRDRPDGEAAHLLPGEPDRGRCAKVAEDPQRLAQQWLLRRPTPSRASPSIVGAAQIHPEAGRARPRRRRVAAGRARRTHRVAAGTSRSPPCGPTATAPRPSSGRRTADEFVGQFGLAAANAAGQNGHGLVPAARPLQDGTTARRSRSRCECGSGILRNGRGAPVGIKIGTRVIRLWKVRARDSSKDAGPGRSPPLVVLLTAGI